MTSVNFRELDHWFHNMKGQFVRVRVRCESRSPNPLAEIVIRMYPWWDHPNIAQIFESNSGWGFEIPAEAYRDVVIRSIEPVRCDTIFNETGKGMSFFTDHPKLWEFEKHADIFCNSQVNVLELIRKVLTRTPACTTPADIVRYVSRLNAAKPPFWLGKFPATLFFHVRAALREMGVQDFVSNEPARTDPFVLCEIEGVASIVARDFMVDLPDFEHRPEWITRPDFRL